VFFVSEVLGDVGKKRYAGVDYGNGDKAIIALNEFSKWPTDSLTENNLLLQGFPKETG
jgi:hypothetical protein